MLVQLGEIQSMLCFLSYSLRASVTKSDINSKWTVRACWGLFSQAALGPSSYLLVLLQHCTSLALLWNLPWQPPVQRGCWSGFNYTGVWYVVVGQDKLAGQSHNISATVVLANTFVVRHQGIPEKPCMSKAVVMTSGAPTVTGAAVVQHLAMLWLF